MFNASDLKEMSAKEVALCAADIILHSPPARNVGSAVSEEKDNQLVTVAEEIKQRLPTNPKLIFVEYVIADHFLRNAHCFNYAQQILTGIARLKTDSEKTWVEAAQEKLKLPSLRRQLPRPVAADLIKCHIQRVYG